MTCHRIGGAIVCTRGPRRPGRPAAPRCRWPGCDRKASKCGWACQPHWHRLPPSVRDYLWRADADRAGPAWSQAAALADRHAAEAQTNPPAPAWRQPELPL